MPMRSSSLANNPLAITRELDGRYDVVLQVRDNLDLIEQVAGIDFATILAELESAQDFTGITVLQGETVAWDAVNKILTVPKGDKGDKGDTGLTGPQGTQGIQGPQGIKGDTGLKGDTGSQGPKGFDGAAGAQGPKGDTGDDLTITQITYNGNGTFNWLFSDGTTYMTPDLKGPKGDTGDQGIKGDQGISVHHLKGTSTTNPVGDFGTSPFKDTYTFYGDADETLNLGWFVVTNGVSDGMSASVYDANGNGIVDNSEKLGGELPSHYVNVATDQTVAGNKTFAGNVVVQGDLTISGNVVAVDVETVTVKDNLILLNSGEVGAGVTAGEAGIIVDRGTETDYKFVFDEVSDSFKVGQEGSLQKVATREDSPINGGVAVWNATEARFDTTTSIATELASKITRPVSTTHRVVKFGDTNGSVVDSNLVSNSRGDLGLNVSPSLWHNSVRALETAAGALFNYAGTKINLIQNAYQGLDGVYRYKSNAPATLLIEENGEFKFSTAPSGITEASATFTERMKLDNAGILTVATAAVGTKTTQVATTAFVNAEINKIEEW